MASIKTLSDISKQLDEILDNLGCCCPSEDTLSELIPRLIAKASPSPPAVPVVFTAPERKDWISPPFYTHHRGYKMSLAISTETSYSSDMNASLVRERRCSCFATFILVPGEFDDYLRFPIRMSIELHVMKKDTNESNSVMYNIDGDAPIEATRRQYLYNYNRRQPTNQEILLFDDIPSYCSIDGTLTFKIPRVVINN